jgi:hypothetical protein
VARGYEISPASGDFCVERERGGGGRREERGGGWWVVGGWGQEERAREELLLRISRAQDEAARVLGAR